VDIDPVESVLDTGFSGRGREVGIAVLEMSWSHR
jgi:hypothetical protein